MYVTFPEILSDKIKCPWTSRLFNNSKDGKAIQHHKKEIYHTYVMKCMFLAKRGRPDILTGVSVLSIRVQNPNEEDWNKLKRLLSYLKNNIDIVLKLEADDYQELKWNVDASFGTLSDLKSHTGWITTLRKGAICNNSSKQKVNARSSIEAELISINNKISKIIWMKRFIDQDNTSTVKMAENGKYSSGKRTRHFDIKFLYYRSN